MGQGGTGRGREWLECSVKDVTRHQYRTGATTDHHVGGRGRKRKREVEKREGEGEGRKKREGEGGEERGKKRREGEGDGKRREREGGDYVRRTVIIPEAMRRFPSGVVIVSRKEMDHKFLRKFQWQ